ncbi:hypothetical protein Lal_00033461 [Lupinus albus]|nr:hypothetical protein Lal_00033461 [Lupinus albus]
MIHTVKKNLENKGFHISYIRAINDDINDGSILDYTKDDIVLIEKLREKLNGKLEMWRKTLEVYEIKEDSFSAM